MLETVVNSFRLWERNFSEDGSENARFPAPKWRWPWYEGIDVKINCVFQQTTWSTPTKQKSYPSERTWGISLVEIQQDDGQQYTLPELDIAVITGSEHDGFQVTEWVEQKQWMVPGTCAIPVGNNILLLSVGLTDQDRYVENQLLSRLSNHSSNHHFWSSLVGFHTPFQYWSSKFYFVTVWRQPHSIEWEVIW